MGIKMSKNQVDKNKIDNNQKNLIIQQQISSPLPPPEWIEKYNNINPKIIEEIIYDFREVGEINRKIALEKSRNETRQIKIIGISQWHGFIATMSILLCVLFCAYFDKKEIALGLLSLSFIGIIQSLIRKNN